MDGILNSFQQLMEGQPDKPNMAEVDLYRWAVCDTCGEWCNPADGALCWNCGEAWDEENKPTEQEMEFAQAALLAMMEEEDGRKEK